MPVGSDALCAGVGFREKVDTAQPALQGPTWSPNATGSGTGWSTSTGQPRPGRADGSAQRARSAQILVEGDDV